MIPGVFSPYLPASLSRNIKKNANTSTPMQTFLEKISYSIVMNFNSVTIFYFLTFKKISKFSISVREEKGGTLAVKPGYALLGRIMLTLMANASQTCS